MENRKLFNSHILNKIIKYLPVIIWAIDKDLKFTLSIGKGLQYLHLMNGQTVGKTLFEYFNTRDPNFLPIANHLRALKGECVEYKFQWGNRIFINRLEPIYENNDIIGVVGFAYDITDQENYLIALSSSEEKYKTLFDSASDAIFIMDGEKFIDCNSATLKMFGCKKNEIIGETPYKFSPPLQPDGKNSKDKVQKYIEEALKGNSLTFEWLHQKLDGTPFFAQVTLNRFKLKDKYYLLAIVRDISKEKEALQKVKLLANALESVNDCVSITDISENIIYVNKKFCEIYGYVKEELIGKDISILRSEKNSEEITKEILPSTLQGGWKGELWNRKKNGEEFLIHLNTAPIYDKNNNIIALIGVAQDITQEKILQEKLQYELEKLKILFEFAPDAIFVIDYNGNLIEANKASEELTEFSREEGLGKTFFDLNLFDRLNLIKAAKILYKARQTQPTGPDVLEIKTKTGKFKCIEVSSYPIVLQGKKLILCSARDITERIKLLSELSKAKEEAEKANKSKTIFFASASHEIRTPINAILGFTDVLKEIFYYKSDEEIKKYFDIVQNSAHQLLRTISQILDISRIETGNLTIKLEPISIKKEILTVVEQLSILASKKGLKIETILPKEDILVYADQYTLNGILINTITNSIKYSEKGTIQITLSKDDDFAICKIKDQGIGMSPEFQEKVFEHFTQEAISTKHNKEGAGLGLAITKKFIDLNKGKIKLKSTQGLGTTVTFKIPLYKSQ